MIRVGINGFGRIGRSVFRILSDRQDIALEAPAVGIEGMHHQLACLIDVEQLSVQRESWI